MSTRVLKKGENRALRNITLRHEQQAFFSGSFNPLFTILYCNLNFPMRSDEIKSASSVLETISLQELTRCMLTMSTQSWIKLRTDPDSQIGRAHV